VRALNFVYVVGNGRAVKIGKSTTPEARIASLKTASSSGLVTYYVGATNGDSGAIERGARSLLSAFRLRGEWFAAAPEAAIAAVEATARSLGVPLMRVDAGPTEAASAGFPPDPRGVGELKGFRKIWAQPGTPLTHKLNLSVLRVLGAILSLAAIFAVGALLALIFEFVRS